MDGWRNGIRETGAEITVTFCVGLIWRKVFIILMHLEHLIRSSIDSQCEAVVLGLDLLDDEVESVGGEYVRAMPQESTTHIFQGEMNGCGLWIEFGVFRLALSEEWRLVASRCDILAVQKLDSDEALLGKRREVRGHGDQHPHHADCHEFAVSGEDLFRSARGIRLLSPVARSISSRELPNNVNLSLPASTSTESDRREKKKPVNGFVWASASTERHHHLCGTSPVLHIQERTVDSSRSDR